MSSANTPSCVEASIRLAFETQKLQLIEQLSALEQQVVNSVSLQACTLMTGPSPMQSLGEDNPEQVASVQVSDASEQVVALAATVPQVSNSIALRTSPKKQRSDSSLPSSPKRQWSEISLPSSPKKEVSESNISNETYMLQMKADQSKSSAKLEFSKLEEAQHGVFSSFHGELKRRSQRNFIPKRVKLPVKEVLDHPVTIKLITCLILANALIMAVEADFSIKRSITGWQSAQAAKSDTVVVEAAPAWFIRADWFFAVVFTVEVAARFMVHESEFFLGDDVAWNALDTLVVMVAWIEIVGGEQQETKGMPPLRLFRLVRVIRSFRVIRSLRFFAELRLVMLSLAHAAKPLMWCSFMLFLILFIFANLFLQITSMELENHNPYVGSEDDWPQQLMLRFPNFGDAVVSLLAYAFGSISWLDPFHAFHEANIFGGYAFLFYMVVIVLGVLNVISAVFVEGALSKAKSDRDLMMMQEQSTRKEMAKRLIDSFREIDKDGSGHLTLEEWQSFLNTKGGEQFMVLFDIDRNNAEELYELLDVDGDGAVMIDEFVMGFLQVCGSANKADALLALKQTQTTLLKLKKLITKSRADLRALLAGELKKILQHVEANEQVFI